MRNLTGAGAAWTVPWTVLVVCRPMAWTAKPAVSESLSNERNGINDPLLFLVRRRQTQFIMWWEETIKCCGLAFPKQGHSTTLFSLERLDMHPSTMNSLECDKT